MANSDAIKTPQCRFAFTQGLFKPQENMNGSKSYSCTLLFDKNADLKPLRDIVVAAAVTEWGDKAKGWLADGTIKNPFLDGDGKQGKSKKTGEPHAGFPGTIFIRPKSGEAYKPKLVNERMIPIIEESELYSGCYGQAVVNAFTWETRENGKGISFGIAFAQKQKDGDRLGGSGGGEPTSWFDKIEDKGDAPTTTGNGKGAAGLFG